jgi:SAM-dependent methyltransferase
LIFPFLIEPHVPSSRQVLIWSILYVLFALAAGFLIWRGRLFPAALPREDGGIPHWKDRLIWAGLSACGTMLLLSVTNHFTQDIAPIPLFWVLPLALYLLSFILVFWNKSFYPRKWVGAILPVILFLLSWFFFAPAALGPLGVNILFFCGGLFLGCLFCNGELALRRPPARFLTHFYLMISLGGALGAVLVGIGAPWIFTDFYEFHLTLLLMFFMAAFVFWNQTPAQRIYLPLALLMMVCNFINQTEQSDKSTVLRERDFYAVSKVFFLQRPGESPCLTLFNGSTGHGSQFTDPGISMEPTTYYSRRSGIGLALDWKGWGAKKVGVIGLGAGTLAAYGKAGDDFRFYEINPQVIQIARNVFSFLKNTQATTEVVEGDGRLALQAEPPQQFDVLVLDAFSGDSIPVHLLTKEAFALYFSRLKPEGILAVHLSNVYLNLAPVARLAADDDGYPSVLVQNESDPGHLVFAADWVLITKNQKFLEDPFVKAVQQDWPVPPGFRAWTDDDNSLFPLFKSR